MGKSKEISRKRWFFPVLLVAYLLFGVWFGSLNYRVFQNQDDYSYMTRLALYTGATIYNEGWMCDDKKDINSCILFGDRKKIKNGINFLAAMNAFKLNYQKSAYITAIALLWPAKIIFNLAILVLTILVTVSTVSLVIFVAFFAVLFNFLMFLISSFLNFLL